MRWHIEGTVAYGFTPYAYKIGTRGLNWFRSFHIFIGKFHFNIRIVWR